MRESWRESPSQQRPLGPVAGGSLGIIAGLLMATVWAFGAWDVALALTAVFLGLVAAVTLGAPAWRPFGLWLLAGATAVAGVIAMLH
jgi:hypothetical protein